MCFVLYNGFSLSSIISFFTVDYIFTPSLYTLAVDVLFPFFIRNFIKIKTKYKIEVNDNTSIAIHGLFLLQNLFYTKYIKRTKYLLHI